MEIRGELSEMVLTATPAAVERDDLGPAGAGHGPRGKLG